MSIKNTASPPRNPGTSSRPLSCPTHFQVSNNWRLLALILLLLLVALPSLLLYRAAHRSSVFLFPLPISSSLQSGQSGRVYDSDELKLVRVLNEAAMEDGKTVILTTLNGAWAATGSIIDLFLESFHIGEGTKKLLKHLVIIALDQNAHARCLALHTHCFALTTDGVDFSQEAYFMTPSYLKMMWRRIEFLKSILEMGYNFVFTVITALLYPLQIEIKQNNPCFQIVFHVSLFSQVSLGCNIFSCICYLITLHFMSLSKWNYL
ncbi:hypothetical protein Scep_022714 [Stephania cephalantha]|uniref:Nucleotide-diphospho-sugar transferase domain-containing protein n=1 Tax=Stephania cephalantha TaxID=152367 RepID=A0AAP0I2H0_9MAGN